MTRILVLDESEGRFAKLANLANAAGYQLVHAESKRRLILEMRAAPAAAILVCADLQNGNGLEVVSESYSQFEEPLPVLGFSAKQSVNELIELAPRSLLLSAVVAPSPDPSSLLASLLQVVPPIDPSLALQVLADSKGDAGVGEKVEDGPRELESAAVARMLTAMHRCAWSGTIEVHGLEAGSLLCEISDGSLVGIRTQEGGDLLETARIQGRLDGITLPPVTLTDPEEEVGLLMAMRAIQPHEVPLLHKDNRKRLLRALFDSGAVSAQLDSKRIPKGGDRTPLLACVLGGLRDPAELGFGLPGSTLTVSLPRGSHRGLQGVPAELVQSLSSLEDGTSLGSFVTQFAGSDPSRREESLAFLATLHDLGYIDYAVGLFELDVAEQLEQMVRDLHRWSRANYFEVLGVGDRDGDRVVRDRMRKLSMLYHPDRMVGAHPRVLQLSEVLYGKVHEVFKEMETSQLRSEYRESLRSGQEGDQPGSDQNSARVAMAQASILVKQKRYGDASQLYRDATLHAPESAEAHMWLGWCRYLSEPAHAQECIVSLEHALTLNSRLRDAYFYLGRIHLLEKDYQKARALFTKANTPPLEQPNAPGHAASSSELRLMDSRGLGLSAEGEAERGAASTESSGAKGLFSRFRRG